MTHSHKKNHCNLSLYLSRLHSESILTSEVINSFQGEIKQIPLINGWEADFCSNIGYASSSLPWNILRASQFDLGHDYKTIVCCDPVLMQMTHRGAYLWGQEQINFSKEEAIRLIAQINQQLMGDDESFYLLSS